jgi:hypothetical protein
MVPLYEALNTKVRVNREAVEAETAARIERKRARLGSAGRERAKKRSNISSAERDGDVSEDVEGEEADGEVGDGGEANEDDAKEEAELVNLKKGDTKLINVPKVTILLPRIPCFWRWFATVHCVSCSDS